MAIGAAKRILFPCDATLPDHPGAGGCHLTNNIFNDFELLLLLSRPPQSWKHEKSSNSQNFCRGIMVGPWKYFFMISWKLRCGLEGFGWAASKV